MHESDTISIPEKRSDAYDILKEKLEKGVSVMPHLSKKIKGMKFSDVLLFDWGIHHFHLGSTFDSDGFVDQHNDIVYAIVENDDVYMIEIGKHKQ